MEKAVSRRQFVIYGATAATLAALGLSGCGSSGSGSKGGAAAGNYKDGTFTGQSKTMDAGVDGDGYGVVTVTVENGKIVDVTFDAFLPDGTPKDKDYGKSEGNYALAQKVLGSKDTYAADLVATGDPSSVDVVTGATFLHDQFVEAAEDALKQAK